MRCNDRCNDIGQMSLVKVCKLDISKDSFTVKMARAWPRLSREAADAPSLAVFKARLDGALSNLV